MSLQLSPLDSANQQQLEKQKVQWQEDELFMRSVYISSLTEKDFSNLLGAEWRSSRPTKIDLSGERYQLDTLEGPAGGLLHEKLQKSRITLIDVSNNNLLDLSILNKSNGFDSLVTIIARRNLIARLSLSLPRLLELNLSYNELRVMPSLAGLPSLEVLILSHNSLSGSIDSLKSATRIKRLDLAYNRFDWTPSQMAHALDTLSHLRSLVVLRVYHNNFIACFKEYQIFVVRKLKSLVKLDDMHITIQMRLDIDTTHLNALDVYDDAFKKRQIDLARRQGAGSESTRFATIAKLYVIMESLEDILEDPSFLTDRIVTVREHAAKRADLRDQGRFNVEEEFWQGIDASDAARDVVISALLELIVTVMERHDTARSILIETLGYLSCVVSRDLGKQCLDVLRRMFLSSEQCREEASDGLRRIVVPTVLAFGKQDIYSPSTKVMLDGLCLLAEDKDIREEVCEMTADLCPMLLDWFLATESLGEDDLPLVRLFAFLTSLEDNAQSVASPDLANRCLFQLESKTVIDNARLRPLWIDILKIAENLIRHCSEEIVEIFYGNATHAKVIVKARAVLASTRGRHNENPIEARTISFILDFVSSLMQRKKEVIQECSESIGLHVAVCGLLRSHVVDPLILTSACQILTVMLSDPVVYAKQAFKIAEDLRKVTPLLQFLGPKKYPDLYRLAKQNAPHKEQTQNHSNSTDFDAPPFNELDNDLVTDAMIGIVQLVGFFAAENDDIPDDMARTFVNDAMNVAGRETILLSLLVIPVDDLKLVVMRSLSQVPLSQIEPDEMGAIVKCLSDTTDIGSGKSEEMLALVMNQLKRLLLAPGETGQSFQVGFAERGVAEGMDILIANARRATSKEAEEHEKLQLSSSIVSFFFAVTGIVSLRGSLRNLTVDKMFPQIMKYEEELHSPSAKDVTLEQTWVGRSLENLLQCLLGDRQLVRNKKVAFRVFARMANILEGRSDYIQVEGSRKRCMQSLAELARGETKMWDLRSIIQGHMYLDNDEWEDRAEQAEGFVNAGGPLRVLEFLLDPEAEDREEYQMDQFNKAAELPETIVAEIEAMAMDAGAVLRDEQHRDEALEVDMHQDGGNEYEKTAGRDALMIALQRDEDNIDDDNSALFALRPDSLGYDEKFFQDPEKGEVNFAYPVAAFFRILYALLVVPPTPSCRRDLLKELRQPEVIAKMLALVTGVASLACNVAAKFLTVMTLVLTIGAEHDEIGFPKLETYSVVALHVQQLAESMLYLLKLTKDQHLDSKEEVLSIAVARFMSTMTLGVPCVARFSDAMEFNQIGIEKCLDRLIPGISLRVFIAMVLYDLQMDVGAGARAITDHFVLQGYGRNHMKSVALTSLSRILVRCRKYRYDVLEVFSVSEVFLAQNVRPSFLGELLEKVNMGNFTIYIESFLYEYDAAAAPQRVVAMETVEVGGLSQSGFVLCLLALTDKKVYLLEPSKILPPYAGPDLQVWDASWEALSPRQPKVIWEREYSSLVSIWRSYGTQLLALEWKGAGKRGDDHGDDAAANGDPNKIYPEVYLFHQEGVRENIISNLQGYSAVKTKGPGAQLMSDPVFRNEIFSVSGKDTILAVAVAAMGPLAAGTGLFAAAGQASPKPRLFVLTEKTLLIFDIHSEFWHAPQDAEHRHVEDDHTPEELVKVDGTAELADAGSDEEEFFQLPSEEEMAQRHADRIKTSDEEPDRGASRPENRVLKLFDKEALPPSEIHFETRNEADLTVHFNSKGFCIRFYTDSSRESWRRALAYLLTKSSSAWERKF